MTRTPRERMVLSAAQLVRIQGVGATGMRDVVAHAEAPRGSLQHYFPGGKDQLIAEAVAWAGDYAARRVARVAAKLEDPTPGKLFAAMAAQWRDEFTAQGFDAGCPLVATVADTAATSDGLREAVGKAFDGWQRPLAATLEELGVPVGPQRRPWRCSCSAPWRARSSWHGRTRTSRRSTRWSRSCGPLLDGAVSTVD